MYSSFFFRLPFVSPLFTHSHTFRQVQPLRVHSPLLLLLFILSTS
jgi:hypothetical protein